MGVDESQTVDKFVPQVRITWRDAIWQILATCVAQSIVMQGGINLAFSAILLPQLRNDTSSIVINDEQASWIASMLPLFLPVGSLAIGLLNEKFGPKLLCLFSSIPIIVSWILFAFSSQVYHLYIARSLAGFGAGLSNVALVYVSEISHPVFRPMLLGFISVFVSFGILLTCILGFWCSWRTMAVIFLVLAIISTVAMAIMPDSPYWLVTFHDEVPMNRVTKSLQWLYKNEQIYDQQLQEIIRSKPKSSGIEKQNDGISNKIVRNLKIFIDPTVYKPTIILFILFILQQLSGAYVTIVYAVDVFTKIGGQFGNGIDEYVALVFLGAIRFVVAIVSSLVSKKVGRRILLQISWLGMFFSCMSLSIYILHYKTKSSDIFALISFLSFVCFASLAVLVIPWSLIGELLPVRVKGKVGGLIITFVNLLMFVVVKTFPSLMNSCDIETVFLIFALDNIIAACFVFWFLPETFGKSFADIENYFK